MSSLSRPLFVFAVVIGLIGAILLLMFNEQPLAGAATIVSRRFTLEFAEPPWRWLLWGALGTSGVALLLSGVEWLLSLGGRHRSPDFALMHPVNVREAVNEVSRRLLECTRPEHPEIITAFNELVRGAASIQASDIHLSPVNEGLRITYRVHGTLYEVATLDAAMAPLLATRIKVLARLEPYVRGTPQDGRLVIDPGAGSVEARVSTLPTGQGERIVLRLVRGSRVVPDITALGFSSEVESGLRELLARPQGLLFVTGPVGSGKTTTLYAALQHISQTRGRLSTLVTLEDPIEIELPFATQTQIHPKAGMTFASALRSVLRQDPNVLMVGEIRDRETAEIAAQAGLTGHLILTTVHGQSAAGPFTRMIDIGIEPFVMASATLGCLSQRLVRTLCTACRRQAEPEPIHIDRFSRHGIDLPRGPFYEPVGCDFCEGQGFTGRTPIAELLIVGPELRQAVNERQTMEHIEQLAIRQGMTTLLREGLSRAASGETSLTEVLRVAG